MAEDRKAARKNPKPRQKEVESIFVPMDDEAMLEEMVNQCRPLLEDGKCVLFIPYNRNESGYPLM